MQAALTHMTRCHCGDLRMSCPFPVVCVAWCSHQMPEDRLASGRGRRV